MLYFIVNPNASSGRSYKIWKKLELIVKRRKTQYRVLFTEYPGHATKLAAQLTAGTEKNREKILAVLGGDGTLNEVIQGIHLQASVKLGYIPAGSGNDFCRGMGLSRNPEKALMHILKEEPAYRMLDYGVVTGTLTERQPVCRRFVVSSGAGFDAAVCAALTDSHMKKVCNRLHVGRLSYILVGLGQILCHRRFAAELVLDNGRRIVKRRISFVSAHIMPSEGGGFQFAPGADPQDGVLSLCVVSGVSRLSLIPVLLCALLRIPRLPQGAEQFQCREAELILQDVLPVHTDGERCADMQRLQFRCESRKIRLIG